MLIVAKKLIYLMIIAIMMAGCSTKAVIGNDKEQTGPSEKSGSFFSQEPSDRDLYEDALSYLSNNEKEPNYNEVRVRLENLIVRFPKSKWIASAQALLSTLDRIFELQKQLNQEKQKVQGDQSKLAKDIKQLEEKYSTDIIRLQQENEQLKNDIRQLKNLEIHLEKREKMLR